MLQSTQEILKSISILLAAAAMSWPGQALRAQTFQNNNFSCEEKQVVGSYQPNGPWFNIVNPHTPNQITCGRFNDDTNLGAQDFADCVVLRDVEPFAFDGQGVLFPGSLSFLKNSGAHGNNCLNAGGSPQFLDAATLNNTGFDGDVSDTFFLGSLVSGNLDSKGFSDIAWVSLDGSFTNPTDQMPAVQYLTSQASGGLGGPNIVPKNALFQKPNYEYTPFPSYFLGPFSFAIGDKLSNNKRQLSADKSMVLADCNEDGLDDAILLARENELVDPGNDDDLNIMISVNNGGTLQPVTTDANLTVLDDKIGNFPMANNRFGATLTRGDFNQDGHVDLIATSNHIDFATEQAFASQAVLCQGDGACHFDCSTNDNSNIRDLGSFCPGNCIPAVHSAVSGDFNGDGRADLALSDTRSQFIHYLWNNGGAFKNWQAQSVTPTGLDFQAFPAPTYIAKGRFSTTAIQKGIDEVVVPFLDANVAEYGEIGPQIKQFSPKILLFAADGQGGILPYEAMFLNLPKLIDAVGIAANDFDHCGGDDFVVLAWQDEGQGIVVTSRASLFLNQNEAPELQTTAADANGLVGETFSFSASCADPTFDDRAFSWELLQAPAGANAVFDVPNGSLIGRDNSDFSSKFTADKPGEYDIQISCEDFCGAKVTKNFKVLLTEEAPPTTTTTTTGGDSTTGGTTPVPNSAISQGGCVANLNGTDLDAPSSALPYLGWGFALLGVLGRRFRRPSSTR